MSDVAVRRTAPLVVRRRILHLVGTANFAGTERYVVEVAGEQSRRGHRVHVVGGEEAAMRALLPAAVRFRPGATTVRALLSMAWAGRQDVVHSHTPKADFVAVLGSPLSGGRRVSTRHIAAPRGYGRLARALAPWVERSLARELAVSAFLAGQVDTRPDAVVLNGVRSVSEPAAGAPRQRVVLVAQRLAAEKDTATALEAWRLSGLSRRGWQLHVAGDGEERARLEAQARAGGAHAGVRFLGWVDDTEAAFRTAGVLLAPAPAEPCGLSVLEAMAHALPVVASAAGGHLETVGAVPGAAMFPPGDAAGAARELVRLAADDAVRRAYGEALQRWQRAELSLETHVDRLEEEYAAALAPARP